MKESYKVFRKLSLIRTVATSWELCNMRWIPWKKKKKIYDFVQLPKERNTLKNKWVFMYLRDIVQENRAKLKKIHTNNNALNMLTKVVPKQKLQLCIGTVGLNSMLWSYRLMLLSHVLKMEIVRLSLSIPWKVS